MIICLSVSLCVCVLGGRHPVCLIAISPGSEETGVFPLGCRGSQDTSFLHCLDDSVYSIFCQGVCSGGLCTPTELSPGITAPRQSPLSSWSEPSFRESTGKLTIALLVFPSLGKTSPELVVLPSLPQGFPDSGYQTQKPAASSLN